MSLRRLNASLLSPLLAFPVAWILAALLAQVHLLDAQGSWSTVMIAVVVAVPLAFVSGGVIGEAIAAATTAIGRTRTETRISEHAFRRLLAIIVAIGLLEVVHQFARAGTVPLLSGSIDDARFSQGGPTIVLTDLLTVAAIAALTRPRELFARESRFELTIAAVAIGAFGLQAGRGSVVLPIVVAIAARWLYWGRPHPYLLTGGALIAVLAIAAGFYLRVYQHPTTPFEAELFGEILPPLPFFLKPLIPLYLALTTNFLALEGIVGHFPTVSPFGHGVYDLLALDNFVSGAQNVSDVSASTTPPWVTSTVAGAFWADGGFAVLVPGVALTGALSAGAYAAAARTRSFRWSLVGAYLFFVALFGLYTNLWTQHVDWLIVTSLLLVFGAFAEDPKSPPGVVGRIWGKIRRMRERGSEPASGAGSWRPEFGGSFRTAIVAGAAAIAALLVAGLAIQATLPEPYPLISTQRLPRGLLNANEVITVSDHPNENSTVWWIDSAGDRVDLHAFDPSLPAEGGLTVDSFRLEEADSARFDIAAWPPLRDPALFVTRQRGDNLETFVRRTDGQGVYRRFVSTVSPPPPGGVRDIAITSYGGTKPDLFVIDRNQENARVRVRVLSGETGFRRQVLATALPFRGLAPSEWSLDVGAVAVREASNPSKKPVYRADLALIQKDPDRAHASFKVMLGEEGFQGFDFQRDIDTPGDVPPDTVFRIAAHSGATALYEIDRSGRRPVLRIFSIEPPTGIL